MDIIGPLPITQLSPRWTLFDAEGRIQGSGAGIPAPEPGWQVWWGEELLGVTHYFDAEGQPQERPPAALPVVQGNTVSFPDFPPEAVVTVTNQAGDRLQFPVADGALTLDDPGAYSLDVASPFPHWPVEAFKLEV